MLSVVSVLKIPGLDSELEYMYILYIVTGKIYDNLQKILENGDRKRGVVLRKV